MKKSFALVCFSLGGWAVSLTAADAKKAGPDVLVVADAHDTDAAAMRPTRDRPVYYYLVDQLERTIGKSYAGEKLPPRKRVEEEVVKALASQNYLRTEKGGVTPSLCIMVLWGTANAAIDTIPGDDGGDVFSNKREMTQLTGAGKATRRNNVDPFENEKNNENLRDDRVYLMLGAFDAQALAKKQKKLVWRTTMSIDTMKESFPASLTTMLASAAPYFGRDAAAPIIVGDRERKANVTIAPFKVIENDAKSADQADSK